MGRIKKLLDRELVGGTTDEEIYPISSTKAIYDENNQTVDYLLKLYLDKLNKLFARQGYYVCDSISTEPDKEIQVNNFELSTTIRLLVRMSKANLATSVSFEVNTTGAYPLYYNGAPASPENTWEADEVLDIYFDGNFFQAFRSKGSDTDALWELRVDEEGNDYLYTDKNVVIAKGLITYSSIAPIVPSIYEGIPFDNKTIWLNKETGVVEVIGSTGGGGLGDIKLIKTTDEITPSDENIFSAARTIQEIKKAIGETGFWRLVEDDNGNRYLVTDYNVVTKGGITAYYDDELNPGGGGGLGGGGSLADIEVTGEGNVLANVTISEDKSLLTFTKLNAVEKDWLTEELKKYVDKTSAQDITGIKNFVNGLKIGSKLLEVRDEVLYINCDLAVTGGVTAYAEGTQLPSTIWEGAPFDNVTIHYNEETKVIEVIGGTGGGEADSVEWNNIKNKPSWIGSTKPTYNWSEIQNKPTWVTTTNPSYTKAESDSKYVTALGISGNNLTWTKNGTTNNITIPYATNADKLDNYHEYDFFRRIRFNTSNLNDSRLYTLNGSAKDTSSPNWTGSFFGFHSSASNQTLVFRLMPGGTSTGITGMLKANFSVDGNRWAGDWKTVAFTDGNVASATKLQTARNIWGQSFNGQAPVSGRFEINGSGNRLSIWDAGTYRVIQSYDNVPLVLNPEGNNVGIGTTTASHKLDVAGKIKFRGNESCDITTIWKSNGTITNLNNGNGYCAIRNALNFQWYNTNWYIGNIRGGSTNSDGFGIANGNTCYMRVNTDKTTIYGDFVVKGNILSEGGVTAYSDERLKTDIKPLENRGYITPVTYIKNNKSSIGFVAQEVREKYPELVTEDNTEHHYLSVNYSQYVAVLQAQIIELNERIKKLEQLNN